MLNASQVDRQEGRARTPHPLPCAGETFHPEYASHIEIATSTPLKCQKFLSTNDVAHHRLHNECQGPILKTKAFLLVQLVSFDERTRCKQWRIINRAMLRPLHS